jgi:uncharacterized protein (TIGR02466 family)
LKKQDLWATPVWSIEIPSIDPRIISQEVYERQTEDPGGNNASRSGGYNSSIIKSALAKPETKKLITLIEKLSVDVFAEFGFSHLPKITGFWVNIFETNDYTEAHCHPGSTMSAVYWSKVPENSGDLLLHNRVENDFIQMTWGGWQDNKYNMTRVKFPAQAGTLVIFPSWLTHSVERNLSGEDRISLGFNLS